MFFGKGGGKALSAEESIELLREYCDSAEKTISVTKKLHLVTDKLVAINLDRSLSVVTRILQVRILGVALMLTEALSDKERLIVRQQWERVSFRIFGLFRNDARAKVGDYIKLAAWIIREGSEVNFKEIMAKLRILGSEHNVEEGVKDLLKKPAYENFEEECRYILWRYEEYLADQEGAKVNQELREKIWAARSTSETIEHIFPQNPVPGGPWKGKLNSHARIEKHVDRIGNLLLLPPGLNSKAGNKGFKEKKEIYEKAEGLRIVKEVLKKRDWNQAAIDQREKKIGVFLIDSFVDIPVERGRAKSTS